MTTPLGGRHPDPAFATTLAHGLSLLQTFRHGEPALSNRELSDRTGLSKATISRLTSTLVQRGRCATTAACAATGWARRCCR